MNRYLPRETPLSTSGADPDRAAHSVHSPHLRLADGIELGSSAVLSQPARADQSPQHLSEHLAPNGGEMSDADSCHRDRKPRRTGRPSIYAMFDLVATLPTNGPGERAVLLAALKWVNADGILWPSLETWGRVAGMDARSMRRIVGRLVKRGILQVEHTSSGGHRRTTRYRLMMPVDDDGITVNQPGPARLKTRTGASANPDRRCPEPGPAVRGTTKNVQVNQDININTPRAVDDVISAMGIEALRHHPNATPERLAWIARDAPSKRNPAGWAAECIRNGWKVPLPPKWDAKERAKAEREMLLKQFDGMPEDDQRGIIERARRRYPNLARCPDSHPGVRGAVALVMGIDPSGACDDRDRGRG